GRVAVARMRRSVLLPDPFGPRRPTASPGLMLRSIPRSAHGRPYRLARPAASTAADGEELLKAWATSAGPAAWASRAPRSQRRTGSRGGPNRAAGGRRTGRPA